MNDANDKTKNIKVSRKASKKLRLIAFERRYLVCMKQEQDIFRKEKELHGELLERANSSINGQYEKNNARGGRKPGDF